MLIINTMGDQAPLLVWSMISDKLFSSSDLYLLNFPQYRFFLESFINPLYSSQPIASLVYSVFLTLSGPNFYNVLIIFSTLANFFMAYIFLKKFRYALFYALIYTFSSYAYVHVGMHPVLYNMWPVVLCMWVISKYASQEKNTISALVYQSVLATITSLTSSYYGFFIYIFWISFGILHFLFGYTKTIKQLIMRCVVPLIVSGISTLVFLLPYIHQNFEIVSKQLLVRSYQDFFTFSSRPWYLFVPSKYNPWLKNIPDKILDPIKSTGYFLNDDYFHSEHIGNFFGYTFTVALFVLLVLALIISTRIQRKYLLFNLTLILLLSSLMMPPYFTVGGTKFYTLTQLIYTYFPMFRSVARLTVIIHLLCIYLFGYCFDLIKFKPTITRFIIITVTILTLCETYIPIKLDVTSISSPAYHYLRNNTEKNTLFAVYPYERSRDAFFNMAVHKRLLVNPRDYESDTFSSQHFTFHLADDSRHKSLILNKVEYLIAFKNDSGYILDSFFKDTALLPVVEFSDSVIFKVLQ